jgi:beta-phosphoglucomutase
VIFDLDGVLVSTDEMHFRAWKELADREGIPFTRHDNERLKGVSRMESLEIILEKATRGYTPAEKAAMADTKNTRYRELLSTLTPRDPLPGAREVLEALRALGVRTAVGSSSRNAREMLDRVDLSRLLDVVVDGNDILRSKPDPEVFLLAAARMGLTPAECLVVEDAVAGVEAGVRGGFRVLGIGEPEMLRGAQRCVAGLGQIGVEELLDGCG